MYWFTILLPILAVALVVVISGRIASHQFKCKHCSEEFRIKWHKVLVTEHSGHDYRLVCPHCHQKDWCTQVDKIHP